MILNYLIVCTIRFIGRVFILLFCANLPENDHLYLVFQKNKLIYVSYENGNL